MARDSRKIAAILAADVVDYSRLMGNDEAGTLAALAARRAIFDRQVQDHDGRVFGTYLHGLLSSGPFRARLLAEFGIAGGGFDYRKAVDDALDGVAAELEAVLDPQWLASLMRCD